METYNVLILSAGRRVELVNLFKGAAKSLGIQSQIVAGDCSKYAPALYFADKRYLLPRIDGSTYIDEIINICIHESIRLVVPTIDTELELLSRNRERIRDESGAIVLVSNPSVISICADKLLTHEFLVEHRFGSPKVYDPSSMDFSKMEFPLFIKPKSGSSSIGAKRVNDADELRFLLKTTKEPMVQEYLTGQEFTVDVFLDFDSKIISVVPRLRMAVRAGEISKGMIVKDEEIIADVIRLMNVLKPIGHVTVQLMKSPTDIKYIEVNPRFGGGAPMSIMNGANSCQNLYLLLMGKSLEYQDDYEDKTVFLRFDQSIRLQDFDS